MSDETSSKVFHHLLPSEVVTNPQGKVSLITNTKLNEQNDSEHVGKDFRHSSSCLLFNMKL